MRLELEKLEKSLALAHVYAVGELAWAAEEAVSMAAPVRVQLQVERKGPRIHLRGHLETSLAAVCDRCLAPVVWAVAEDWEAVYVAPEDYVASRAEDLSQDDLLVSVHDGVSLELDELVREQILLAVPTQILCHKECQGLCPHCGGNLNETVCACAGQQTDPRWAALKTLKLS